MRTVTTCIAAATLLCGTTASAASLVIEFTGLNLEYDGSKIFDAQDAAGGSADPNLADPISTVEFVFNGNLLGTAPGPSFADILIPDVTGIDPNEIATVIPVDPNSDAYFDLLFGSPVTEYLKLDIDTITITYVDNAGIVQFSFGGGAAAIDGQNLPFNLELDDPVVVSFSTRVDEGTLTDNGTFIDGFTSSGTGEITGDAEIPEPGSLILALLALVAGLAADRSGLRC